MMNTWNIVKFLTLYFIAIVVIFNASSAYELNRRLELYDKHRDTMDSLRTEYIEWLYKYHVVAKHVVVYDTIQVPVVKYIYKVEQGND